MSDDRPRFSQLLSGEAVIWALVIAAGIVGSWFYMQSAVENLQVHVAEMRDDLDEIRNDIQRNRDLHNEFLVSYSRQEVVEDAADQLLRVEIEHLQRRLDND